MVKDGQSEKLCLAILLFEDIWLKLFMFIICVSRHDLMWECQYVKM